MMSNYYIAGPMSGIPKYNFPAFFAAGKLLRSRGYEVLNPAEMDNAEDKGLAMLSPDGMGFATKTWGDFLMRDVKLVADVCDGVVLLPNWQQSRGARLEAFIALTVQKPIFLLEDEELIETSPVELAALIASHVTNQGDVTRYRSKE